MSIIHSNNFNTTLNGAITNSQTTITVASVTNAPLIGAGVNAYITVTNGTDYEIMLATALSGNDFTVIRAQQDTSGTSFDDGDTVFLSATKADFDNFDTPNNVTINGINVGRGTANIATNNSFGTSSLNAVTTGARTASFGYEAGILMTSGSDNCFFGYRAGQKVTTQSGNTCLGSQSGNQSSSTQQTTAVGFKAGAACSSQDSAFGYQALMAGSGDAFGYNVLNASSGTLNCGFGNNTLSNASYSASKSCAFGYNVLPSATSGGQNSAFGHQAGYSATAGSTAITTGNNNSFFGYQSGANAADAVNVIAIGAGAVAEKSTGASSSDSGPGIAFGGASSNLGHRGDGSLYPSNNCTGFIKQKIAGTNYFVPVMTNGSTNLGDSNNNIVTNNLLSGYTSVATAAGTTTLTVSSARHIVFTGSTTQNCDMPAVSTLRLGTLHIITNLSSGVVTVRSSGSNTIQAMQANSTLVLVSNATSGTSAAVWDVLIYTAAASGQTGSGSLVRATSPTLVTPTLGVALATSVNFGQDALDYYDVGTWVPTASFSTPGDLSVSYGTQTGTYTRVGNFVIMAMVLTFTPTFTTSSGSLDITGLPYPAAATIYGTAINGSGFNYPASRTELAASITGGGSTMRIVGTGSGATASNLGTTQFTSGVAHTIRVSMFHTV